MTGSGWSTGSATCSVATSPPLERSFDYAHNRGALVLLTGYQTPDAIRRIGQSRLRNWLLKRKVRSADQLAATAVAAAKTQHRWRAVNAPHLVALVRAGAKFKNGKLLERPDESGGHAHAA